MRYGLTSCRGGFAINSRLQPRTGGKTDRYCSAPTNLMPWRTLDGESLEFVPLKGALDGSSSDGVLSFAPASVGLEAEAVVSELDLLLTAGRLSDVSRLVIEREYSRARDEWSFFYAAQARSFHPLPSPSTCFHLLPAPFHPLPPPFTPFHHLPSGRPQLLRLHRRRSDRHR